MTGITASRTPRIIGGVLIVLGFTTLIVHGVPYHTTDNVARFGTIRMDVTEQKRFEIPPLVGGCLILAGAALLFLPGPRPPA